MNELSEREVSIMNSMEGESREFVNRLVELLSEKEDMKRTKDAEDHANLVNLEELYNQLENNYYDLQKTLQSISSEKDYIANELDEQKKKSIALEDELVRVEKEHSGSGDVVIQLKLENQQLQEETVLAKNLSESRQKQINELSSRIDEISQKCQEIEKSSLNLKSELSESQLYSGSLKIQLDASTERCSLLTEELSNAQKNKMVLQEQFQHSSTQLITQITELKQQVAALQAEKSVTERSHVQCKNDMTSLQTTLESTKKELVDTTASLSLLKTQSTHVLNEQMRIQSLKDDQISDLESQNTALKQVAEEMKKTLEVVNTENARLVRVNKTLEESVKEKDRKLNDMHNRRTTIQEETGLVLSQLQMSEASIRSALSNRGLSITDLYTRIIKLEEELEKARKGKNEAEMQLEHVLREIEEKTPMLQQQQLEYQSMVSSQQRMTRMYACVSDELKKKKQDMEMLEQRMKEEERTNTANLRVIEELTEQVQSLLKQQVEATGTMSFADVKGLQEKNVELMKKVAELERIRADEQKMNEESGALATLQKDLEAIKKEREEQQVLMATLVKQRDMYRVLLAEKDTEMVHNASNTSVSEATATDLKRQLEETTTKMMKMREEYEMQVTNLTSKLNAKEVETVRLEKEIMLVKQNNELSKDSVTHLQSVSNSLEMKVKKQEDDLITLQQAVLKEQKENDAKQEKIIALNGDNASLKQQVSQLTASLEALKETREQWQEERKKLRSIIDEVQQASSAIQLQYNGNLIAKQNELERLEKHCKEMEGELNELRSVQISRLNEAFEKERVLSQQMNAYQSEIKQLKTQLSLKERKEKEKEESTSEQEKRIKQLESRVNAQLQNLTAGGSASGLDGDIHISLGQYRSIERDLAKKEIEVVSLQNTLENAQKHVEEYRQMAESMEEELKKFKEAKEKEMAALKLQLIEKTTEIGTLKEKESKKEEEYSSSASVIQQQKELIDKHAMEKELLTKQVNDLSQLLKVERSSLETMERNYRSEFQKHSDDLAGWKEKEKNYQEEQVKVVEMKKDLEVREKLVKDQIQQTEEEVKKWKETLAEKELCLDSLKKQNDVLFSQITELTRQHRMNDTADEPDDSKDASMAKLRDVVISLRRENEIAKSSLLLEKNANTEMEKNLRMMEEKEQTLNEQIRELTKELTEIKSKGDIEELLRNCEELKKMMTLYTESNNTLRAENEEIKKQTEGLKSEAEGLKRSVEGLKQNKMGLEQKVVKVTAEFNEYKTNYSVEQFNLLVAAKTNLTAENEKLKTSLTAAQGEIAPLKTQVASLTQKALAAQNRLAALQKMQAAQPKQVMKKTQVSQPQQTQAQQAQQAQAQQVQQVQPQQAQQVQPQAQPQAQQVQQAQQQVQQIQQVQAQPQQVQPQPQQVQQIQAQPQAQQAQQAQPVKQAPVQPVQQIQTPQKTQPQAQAQPQPLFAKQTTPAQQIPTPAKPTVEATPAAKATNAPTGLFNALSQQAAMNPNASLFTPQAGNRLFQNLIKPGNNKRESTAGQAVPKKLKTEAGAINTEQDQEQKLLNRQQRFQKGGNVKEEETRQVKEHISLSEFLLNLRYVIHIRPNNGGVKKVFNNYIKSKKEFLPVQILDKIRKSVNLTPEEFATMRSIKTEEDLNKYC